MFETTKLLGRTWLAGLVLGGLTTVAGCADEEESLIVVRSPIWPDDGTCVVDPSGTTALLEGVLDVDKGTAYVMPAILRNQLLSRTAATSNNRINNAELQLISADVSLTMPQAPEVLAAVDEANDAFVNFEVKFASISLPPSGTSTGGVGVAVQVISDGASKVFADELRQRGMENSQPQVLADVTFHARRTGNKKGMVGEIDSRNYTFPIRLCLGCLQTCATCEDGQCPVDDSGPFGGGVCGNAQDRYVGPLVCGDPNGT